jgi:hypothetical protein
MIQFTLQDIMSLDPCMEEREIIIYMEGKDSVSLLDILSSKASNDDKIWLTVRLSLPSVIERYCGSEGVGLSLGEIDRYGHKEATAHAFSTTDWGSAEYLVAYDHIRQDQVNRLIDIIKEQEL